MIDGTHGQDETITPAKHKLPIKFIFIVLVILIGALLAKPSVSLWYNATPQVDSSKLRLAKVQRGQLIRDVAVSGKIVAANAPQLYSTEPGQVTLLIKPGEKVEKNQHVAMIDSPELNALIEQQASTLEQLKIEARRGELSNKEAMLDLESQTNSAQIQLNVATREKQRSDDSYEKQVISEKDWAKSQDQFLEAEMLAKHANRRVELAKERLIFENQNREYVVQKQQLVLNELMRRKAALTIQAPVSGIVGNWLVAQKDNVADSTPIMTIVDLSEYEAELNVPEFYADDLGIGLTVSMKIAGVNVDGTIIAISPEIKNNQVQVRTNVVSTSQLKLRQNQRLNARIEFEKKENVLMVKRGQFLGSMVNNKVYRLVDQEFAEQTAITIGTSSVDFVEIIAGVEEGDSIIVSDYEDFNAAEKISISH